MNRSPDDRSTRVTRVDETGRASEFFENRLPASDIRTGPNDNTGAQYMIKALLEKGMRPTMARLTLARKIASITLTIWKKGVDFDATQLHRQEA